jgi:DNA-binding transcriptional LysR family regulator
MADHPGLKLRYLTDQRVFRLEYGEAHVAIRAGSRPTEPDNVVQALGAHHVALYASASYIARHGLPTEETLAEHRFIGPEQRDSRAPFYRWLNDTIPAAQVVFRGNDPEGLAAAVREGLGLGFLPALDGRANSNLTEVMGPRPEWQSPLWLVSHVDLHRTPKVQAALAAFKAMSQHCEVM